VCDDDADDDDDDDVIMQIMFKMDVNGNGILIEHWHLNKAMGLHADVYTFDKFRYACILSGCDYVPSLPGIGLVKATKVFQLSRQTDVATVTNDSVCLCQMSVCRSVCLSVCLSVCDYVPSLLGIGLVDRLTLPW